MSIDKSQIAKQTATELFDKGLNCAESALMAVAKAQGIESTVMPDIATCFGGGMGRTGGPCGALTGATMGLGLALGRNQPGSSIQVAQQATSRLVQAFEQEFGAKDCHVLIGFDPKSPDSAQAFNKPGRRERCAIITGRAAEMAANIIRETKS